MLRGSFWGHVARATTLVLAVLAAMTGAVLLVVPAHAAPGGRIELYDIDVTVRADGTLHIKESIFYDFGPRQRHVISRAIPHRERLGDGRTRVYEIANVSAYATGSPESSPATEVTREGASTVVRITKPSVTGGDGHYVISYDVRGALTPKAGRVRFDWDIVGGWPVPVRRVRIEVRAPAPLAGPACFAGTSGSRASCLRMQRAGRLVRFWHRDLRAHEGVTIAAELPEDAVTVPPPRSGRPGERPRATAASGPRPFGVAFGVMLFAAIPGLLWVTGPRRLRGRQEVPVHVVPPDDIPPGPGGVVLAGGATAEHLTATLIDLATRDFLRIEEVPAAGGGVADWLLVRTGSPRPGLRGYEEILLRILFASRDEVRVSELGRQGASFAAVLAALPVDATRRGWFRRSPRAQRVWLWVGAAVVGVAGVFVLTAAPVVAAALLALACSAGAAGLWLVPRTSTGTAVRARLESLRETMSSADAPIHPELDPAGAFGRCLTYAVVFDTVGSWTARCAANPAAWRLPWYHGAPAGEGSAQRITDFTVLMCGVFAAPPPRARPGLPWFSPRGTP